MRCGHEYSIHLLVTSAEAQIQAFSVSEYSTDFYVKIHLCSTLNKMSTCILFRDG